MSEFKGKLLLFIFMTSCCDVNVAAIDFPANEYVYSLQRDELVQRELEFQNKFVNLTMVSAHVRCLSWKYLKTAITTWLMDRVSKNIWKRLLRREEIKGGDCQLCRCNEHVWLHFRLNKSHHDICNGWSGTNLIEHVTTSRRSFQSRTFFRTWRHQSCTLFSADFQKEATCTHMRVRITIWNKKVLIKQMMTSWFVFYNS